MLESILAYQPTNLTRGARLPFTIAGLFSADSFHLGYTIFTRLTLPGVSEIVVPATSDTRSDKFVRSNRRPECSEGSGPRVSRDAKSCVSTPRSFGCASG